MQPAMQQSAGPNASARNALRPVRCRFQQLQRAELASRRATGPCRRRMLVCAEEKEQGNGAPQQQDGASREEARIVKLEQLTKSRALRPRQQRREPPKQVVRKGQWREGELFPVGWEKMGVFEKGWQLWAGERGFLFWSNKLALQAIIVLAIAWVLFRFVGPALGLYTLTNDLLSPPNE